MKNRYLFGTFIIYLFLSISTIAQSSIIWTAIQKSPQVFIENHGQFDDFFPQDTAIRYGVDHGFGWRVLFSKNKTAYYIQHIVNNNKEEQHSFNEESKTKEVETTVIVQEWLNTSGIEEFVTGDELHDYYTYSYLKNDEYINVDHAKAFNHLNKNNIYPGIDLKLIAPQEGGVKYSLHLAAGANPSLIAFTYTGAEINLDPEGNLRMATVQGELVDHAPKAWYAGNEQEEIACEFILNGNTVSFLLGTYDTTRAIVIDPWTVNPALPAPFNRSYEVDADNAGNVFVWGGGMGYNLKKYNAAGTLQWTHVSPWDTSNSWFGELLTAPTGESYITSGSAAKIRRLTAAGATTFTNNGPFFNVDEYWNLSLNCDNTKLVAGGARIIGLTSPQGHLFNLNMANGNQIAGSPYNIRPALMKEVRGLAIGGDGNFYVLTNDHLIAVNQTFGIIYSIPHTTAYPYYSPTYVSEAVQGVNNIDANLTHIYMQYGNTLEKRLNTTGAVVSSIAIPGGGFNGGFGGMGPQNGGLVVDDCGNVYVGSTNAVYKFDANLTLLASVATTGAVYDLKINPTGGSLIIGGNAFLTSNTSLAPCIPHSITCTPPMPVELLEFTGHLNETTNILEWSTASEINNDFFILEKSKDAINYEMHSIISGSGNSNTLLNYSSVDTRPYPTTYYRLKQTDYNGDIKYYDPIVLENNNLSGLQVQSIFPNPANENFTINLFNSESVVSEIQIFDAVGKLVYSQLLLVNGNITKDINCSGWAQGLYIIKITNSLTSEQTNHRIVIE